ncbi:uncharacterized protein LOC134207364 [Armigeres subalbatus]|uniref:uncharacterized protein LOC134207364 n=1 Tax=Armigeres subalbatus TaxID=124917 RepID=UPI002ED1E7C1
MAVAFFIPSVDEDGEPVKPNQQAGNHPQQVGQSNQTSASAVASSDVSQQVCAEVMAEFQKQHLIMVLHEILVAYAREAILAQQPASPTNLSTSEPCLLCKKLLTCSGDSTDNINGTRLRSAAITGALLGNSNDTLAKNVPGLLILLLLLPLLLLQPLGISERLRSSEGKPSSSTEKPGQGRLVMVL